MKIAWVIIVVCIAPLTAFGANPDTSERNDTPDFFTSSKWKISITPYLWAPTSIEGEISLPNSDVDLDFSFSTLATAQKDKWKLIFNGTILAIDGDADLPGMIKAELEIDQLYGGFALGYELCEVPIGCKPDQKMKFIPYGGLRYAYLKEDVDLSPGPETSISKDWVEPFVGAQLLFTFNKKLSGVVLSDFGGFSVGSASTLTWNVLAGIDYRHKPNRSLKIGYRVYDIDYSRKTRGRRLRLDAKYKGPWIGYTFYF
ncbi:MAG: hypothetical protein ACYS8Z_05340 [Planctomycetota bacterium]|jgi:hypothetical protein